MTMTWRTTDLAKWGVGKGSNLTADEFDENFWDHDERIAILEALPAPGASIVSAELEDDQLTFTMSDASILGPLTVPIYVPQPRGVWQPETAYVRGEIVSYGAAAYTVLVNHTSALTFDPGETSTDGDYYGLFVEMPAGTLPAAGNERSILMKLSGDDYDTAWVDAAVPHLGDAGQVLRKISAANYDFAWADSILDTLTDVEITAPTDGQVLTFVDDTDEGHWENGSFSVAAEDVTFVPPDTDFVATDVQAALEELHTSVSAIDPAAITASLALKANIASPTLTGVPAAPTAAADTNTTQIATTAYVQAELTDRARLDLEDQTVTGGARVTSKSLGTITTGTTTLDPGDRAMQHYTNGGAHTLAPGSNTGSLFLDITNNASAGAITTSGWTKVSGDSFTTSNGHKFRCSCSIGDAGSLLNVQAMQ